MKRITDLNTIKYRIDIPWQHRFFMAEIKYYMLNSNALYSEYDIGGVISIHDFRSGTNSIKYKENLI